MDLAFFDINSFIKLIIFTEDNAAKLCYELKLKSGELKRFEFETYEDPAWDELTEYALADDNSLHPDDFEDAKLTEAELIAKLKEMGNDTEGLDVYVIKQSILDFLEEFHSK